MTTRLLSARAVDERIDDFDWTTISAGLDEVGVSLTPPVLAPDECRTIADLYDDDTRFRSTVDMARSRFGKGQYRYFSQPLPELVTQLRAAFWPHLLPIARDWSERRGQARTVARRSRRVARSMPRGRPNAPDTADAAVRGGRLERAAPRFVRRPGVSATSGRRPGAARCRLHRRRVRRRRATTRAQSRATAMQIPAGRALVFTTRDRPIRTARLGERADAPRSKHRAQRRTDDARPYLSRRHLSPARTSWTLIGSDGKPYTSDEPGRLGGHRRSRIYGRLDCPSALRAISLGGYVANRVFFADEATAVVAGFRPCARCMSSEYQRWKVNGRG